MAIRFCFFPGSLGRFKFLIRFFQCLLDQSDDELLLAELLTVGLLIPRQIFLNPLEEFLTYLKCPLFSFCSYRLLPSCNVR